ncbi:MAG: hypothetical protein K0R78_3632 [Pelosinus sp.]|jgi:hypothetical protein|nr:hypothetical protein [Pelosinus sp.]
MPKKLPIFNHIAAIIPLYTQAGDTTTIITTDGKSTSTTTSVRTVLRRLAHSRSTDLTALRHHTTLATGQSILQPLPIAPGLVLCPVKTRIPKVTGDTSTGYINYYAVTGVAENSISSYQSIVKLTGGTDIPVFWTCATVKKHLQSAKLAISHISQSTHSHPDLMPIAQKLVEIIYDILVLKNGKE